MANSAYSINREPSETGASHVTIRESVFKHVPAVSEQYDSLDYEPMENDIYKKEIRHHSYHRTIWRRTFNRWMVCFFTGLVTACIGSIINIIIDNITNWKYQTIQKYFNQCMGEKECLVIPLLVWIAINVLFTGLAASLVVFVAGPVAAGSGIPQIKCFLNGVKIPGVVSLKTLIAKAVGVLFSVSGGLTVGKEGPMIHSGACVAARISQGKTADGRRAIDCHIYDYYRCDTELRDFVSCGSAAGVAVAFGAPIGGVLFSLEEGASFWNQALTWRMFFTSMTCSFFLNLIMSIYENKPGDITFTGLVNFGVFQEKFFDYDIWLFIIVILIGIIGGLLGAFFNFLNHRLTVFRLRYIKSAFGKFFEAIIICTMTCCAGFFLILFVEDCVPIDDKLISEFPVQATCGDGYYSTVATLFLSSPEHAVVKLFHEDHRFFSALNLALFAILQYFVAMWTYGVSVASGLFIPSLLVGATWGRLLAVGIGMLFPQAKIIDNLGLYALAGAAAQLGGNVRMTISLCVILIEATHDISFGLPLMIVLMIAKWVGDLFNEGLYDIHIEIAEVPLLGHEPPHHSASVPVKRVMARPVKVLRQIEKVGKIYDMVVNLKHHAYPIVDKYNPESFDVFDDHLPNTFGRHKGLICTYQLIVMLEHKVFSLDRAGTAKIGKDRLTLADFREDYPKYHLLLNKLRITDADRECYMDFSPYMNRADYCVSENASLTKLYQLFRGLGLRHIIVLDSDSMIVGIVTRKDIARFRSEFKGGKLHQHELLVAVS